MKKLILMKRGFNKICPQCAGSPIFKKYIKTYKKCKKCGLKLSDYKSDDGPAYIYNFYCRSYINSNYFVDRKIF